MKFPVGVSRSQGFRKYQNFRGFGRDKKNPCFLGGFPCLLPQKNEGKEEQGLGPRSGPNQGGVWKGSGSEGQVWLGWPCNSSGKT